MTKNFPQEFVDLAIRLSDTARGIAETYFRRSLDVETKSDTSPVTVADRAIEAAQREPSKRPTRIMASAERNMATPGLMQSSSGYSTQ